MLKQFLISAANDFEGLFNYQLYRALTGEQRADQSGSFDYLFNEWKNAIVRFSQYNYINDEIEIRSALDRTFKPFIKLLNLILANKIVDTSKLSEISHETATHHLIPFRQLVEDNLEFK